MSWTKLEHTINVALVEHQRQINEGMIGFSLPAYIATKLREAGLIRENENQSS
jgi:hypothetical protein